MKKILIVGGTFDNNGGKSSGLIDKIVDAIKSRNDSTLDVHNGGYISSLKEDIVEKSKENDIVIWMPNVSNTEEKIRDIKSINHKDLCFFLHSDGVYPYLALKRLTKFA